MTAPAHQYTFEISLSTLNHLGRQLYRSFATVLGEAISNAWDADAAIVLIDVDKDNSTIWIVDDGVGMTSEDFQKKFLKIGYSKRSASQLSAKERPYFGRKGIGKLALLSCSGRLSILSKVTKGEFVGGVIDNTKLDEAIGQDLSPKEYPLETVDMDQFKGRLDEIRSGTIICFERLKDGAKHSLKYLRKTIALYFSFSLTDRGFRVLVNGKEVSTDDLEELIANTQFLWKFDRYSDPFVARLEAVFAEQEHDHEIKEISERGLSGFLATVKRPKDLAVFGMGERVGVDLFVNGRLRERNILRHVPTSRIAESYLYGQIHFDELDDEQDRFTSSREGVVADDPKYKELLNRLSSAVLEVVDDWDRMRRRLRQDGDAENESISKEQRASESLYNLVADKYLPRKNLAAEKRVRSWLDSLKADASFNTESYVECFTAENLVRKYIDEEKVPISNEARTAAQQYRDREKSNKKKGNVSIDIRQSTSSLVYLSMNHLARLADSGTDRIKDASLVRDADTFRPMRDAVAHTALLTDEAKLKLRSVRTNINGRIKDLLASKASPAPRAKTSPTKRRFRRHKRKP